MCTITDIVWDEQHGAFTKCTYNGMPLSSLSTMKKLVKEKAAFIDEQKREMFLAWKEFPSAEEEISDEQFKNLLDAAIAEASDSDDAFGHIAKYMMGNKKTATISPALCVMELACRRAIMIAGEREIQTATLKEFFHVSSKIWLKYIADHQKRANQL